MALTNKEMNFMLGLLKGMLNLTKAGRENKAVNILRKQKSKAKPVVRAEAKKEVNKPTSVKMSKTELANAMRYFNQNRMRSDQIVKKLVYLSSQNPPTDYSRPKSQIAG